MLSSREKSSASPASESDIEHNRQDHRRRHSKSHEREECSSMHNRQRCHRSKSSRKHREEHSPHSQRCRRSSNLSTLSSSSSQSRSPACRRSQARPKLILVPVERRRSPSPPVSEIERRTQPTNPSVNVYESIDNDLVTIAVSDHTDEDELSYNENLAKHQRDDLTAPATQRSIAVLSQ